MGFCYQCGAKIEEGVAFCPNCGAKQEQEVSQGAPVNESAPVSENVPVNENGPVVGGVAGAPNQAEKKPINKNVLIGIIAAVVALVVILVIVLVVRDKKRTVDINKYVSVEFTGYDTVGRASVDFDYEGFEAAVMKAQGKKEYNEKDLEDMSLSDLSDVLDLGSYSLLDSIETSLDKEEELSNGDEVTVTITYDKEKAKKNGVKFKAKDMKVTVEGLEDVQEVDPFETLEVTYDGVAPNVRVNYENKSKDDFVSDLYFEMDADDNSFDIGDTFTLSLSDSTVEYAKESGYVFTETSKEYTVDKADKYVTALSDITDDQLKDMQTQATDTIEAYCAGSYNKGTLGTLNYEGMYLLVRKSTGYSANNAVYVVYSAEVTSSDGSFTTAKVYYPVEFSSVIVKADKSLEYDSYNSIKGYSQFESTGAFSFASTDGYIDTAEMYKDIITSNKDKYTYEVSKELKQFGE